MEDLAEARAGGTPGSTNLDLVGQKAGEDLVTDG